MDRPTPESITQSTTIDVADRMLSIGPTIVRSGDSLRLLAERAAENPGCRVMAVVDDGDRLTGIIPVRVLVNDIFLKIVPEEFLAEIADIEGALKYAAHIGARSASDIQLEPVSVAPTDTIRDAFRRMHEARLNGLPIVDAERRVIGYVDQLEMLLVWVRSTGREGLLEPHDHDRGDP
jgi:CBS domain-containing protein